jgi:SAM-dependent methyltransferase
VFSRLATKLRKATAPWPPHPIDKTYGIETSAKFHRWRLGFTGKPNAGQYLGYAGSHPSVIRAAIRALPAVEGATFIDLGCGKGRVTAVATEFPFYRIVGIELSPALANRARRNMDVLATLHPLRTRVEVVTGDATNPDLPRRGSVVLFLYNPFRGRLVESLMDRLTEKLLASPELRIFVVCYNPVHANVIDGRREFRRYFADRLTLADEERAGSPFDNDNDSVVIWQSVGKDMAPVHPGATRAVKVTIPDLGAEVQV